MLICLTVIEVVVKFLVTRFVVYVGHTSRFDAFARALIVHVLECVLIEVYGRRPIALRRLLLTAPEECSFVETDANFLSRQEFVDGASVVCRPQLKLFELSRLRVRPPCLLGAVSVHVSVARRASLVLWRLRNLCSLLFH